MIYLPKFKPLGPGSEVAVFYTHEDGTRSASGTWKLPTCWPCRIHHFSLSEACLVRDGDKKLGASKLGRLDTEPRCGAGPKGDTLGEDICETVLNQDVVGETGGKPFSPVLSAEVVEAARVLDPWRTGVLKGGATR